MLKAELRGLLSQAHPESIHDRIENILTSNVFGIFSYLDPNEALLPFLRTASDAGLKPMEVPERCVRVLWRFWPRLQRGKIPDVLLVIESPEVDYVIAIEAKYHARKHGVDDDLDAGPEDPAYSAQVQDQLAKYLVAIKELVKNKDETRRLGIDLGHRHVECAVLYVTQDSMMPIEELEGRVAGLTDAFTEPETWYPIVLGRVYGALRKEGDSETKLKEIYVIEIHIAPDGFADEPVVLLAKVLLTEPGNRNEVWNSWNNEGEWLGKALEPGAASAEVDKEGAKEIWPNAERVVAKVIPLFDIRKEEDILPKLVKPFLKLIEQK